MAVRFGVAGTGYWASEVHLPGLLRTEGAEVVGLWGRTPAHVAAIAAKHGVHPFARLSDMLSEVDAVSIAVQPRAQPDIAVAAAEAGKHLILEKPIALTVEAARGVEAAVKTRGVASVVFFIRRFVPEIAAAIEAARGVDWNRARVRVHSAVMVTDSPYRDSRWRQEPGAALWDIGPHVLAVLLPLLGDVSDINASLDDSGKVHVRTTHQAGAIADISLTLHAEPGEVVNDWQLSAPSRELHLPNPELQRPAILSRAASQLIEQIASGRRSMECDVSMGTRIVELLAQAGDFLGMPSFTRPDRR